MHFAVLHDQALDLRYRLCAVSDVIDRMPKSFRVRDSEMLALTKDREERLLLSELLSKEGAVQVIASATPSRMVS
jgi:hypothetical protein